MVAHFDDRYASSCAAGGGERYKLPFEFLEYLNAVMNFVLDTQEILTVWLVGDSKLISALDRAILRHLKSRLRLRVHLDPFTRQELIAYIKFCLESSRCTRQVCSDTVLDAVFLISRGVPRIACNIMSIASRIAHEQNQDIICEKILETAKAEILAA